MIDLSNIPTAEAIMETLAMVEEFEQMPRSEQFPFSDSYHLICANVDRFGEDVALEFLLQGLPDEASQFHRIASTDQ